MLRKKSAEKLFSQIHFDASPKVIIRGEALSFI